MRIHATKKVRQASPGASGTGHDPLPFEERYHRALENEQLQDNLLRFQRSWKDSRAGAFAAYAENPAQATVPEGGPQAENLPRANGTPEFEAMRNRPAAIKR